MQWCHRCEKLLSGDELFACRRCGAKLSRETPFSHGCQVCRSVQIQFDESISIGNYGGLLQQIVRDVKRAKLESTATQLGRLLAKLMIELEVGLGADYIVPMPIHWWKRFIRGFNGASVIAEGLSQNSCIPVFSGLRFARLTKKQGTLSTTARIANLKNAMMVKNGQRVSGKHVILVDDVATSCATANEAARALKRAGAKKITLAVAARGIRG